MKNILLWLIVFIFLFCGKLMFALTPGEREIVGQMKDTIIELRGQVTAADIRVDAATASLVSSAATQNALISDLKAKELEVQNIILERDQAVADLALQKAKYAALNVKYQRAQFIIAIVTSLLAGVMVFYITQGLAVPYNVMIPLGAAGAVYAATCFIL